MRRLAPLCMALAAFVLCLPTFLRATSSCTTPTVLTTYASGGVNGGTSGNFTSSGDLWVGAISSYTSTTVTVSDNKNGGNWTCGGQQTTTGLDNVQLCYRESPVTGANTTVTLTGSATYPGIIFIGVTGSIGAGAYDQNTSAKTDAGVTLAPGTITPSQADEIVFTNLASGASANADMTVAGNSVVKLSGFDFVGGTNIAGAVGYVIQSTATATSSVLWSSSTSTIGLASAIASFKCTSVGGTPTLLSLTGAGK